MTLVDAINEVADVLNAHGFAVFPTDALREIVARLRPELVAIEAPVVTVEIGAGVDLAGLARHEGGDA